MFLKLGTQRAPLKTVVQLYCLFTFPARTGELRNAKNILVGKSEGKIPLGRPRSGWNDNSIMDLRETG
jgi:hypothetical protein